MNDSNQYDLTQDQEGNPIQGDDAAHEKLPHSIGRYRIKRMLGKGGFGLVYLAHDDQLDRPVAVKVPHSRLVSGPEEAEEYLAEARTVASLEHPHIVPVFDVGSTDEYPCYVVSRFVDGTDLSKRLKTHGLKYRESTELVATVAEAIHYAHKKGLVHRDIKPGNILLDNENKPFVVDFGLALREENIGKGPEYAGTPAYMSPEQARGEGHRVDGRSDVFSLGVVLYQLLAGRRPFRGDSQVEVLEQVTGFDPRPLRQYDEKLPKELERICNRAMAKRASDRYSSAHDMAEDLRHVLADNAVKQSINSPGGIGSVVPEMFLSVPAMDPANTRVVTPGTASLGLASQSSASVDLRSSSDSQPLRIVPKGLRSFDAHDADFFLELLPGPRDRDGLPDSLRFWKTRIEETDADNTFSVGLIYGPSGCGKSSLVKAGLLPRLSDNVISIYVEATPNETEARLMHGLRKKCPALDENLDLTEMLTSLRRGVGIPVDKKVVIFVDQFEQWLHAGKDEQNSELVQALRQCDGGRVQCIVMVRDDFWLAVSRFLRELEIKLVEGGNSALTDLFDLDHARKVLAAFGRAFGKLPEGGREITKEQKEFLKQSVAGLAEDGKVICVRLALFAEMMKGKSWTAATLKELGGTQGVGVTFLEETFSATTAPPEHRYHQKAARAVLRDLLPDSGTDIKGYMRSHAELLAASGYANRPKDFDDLIHLLDSEIRLITPTDPEGKSSADESVAKVAAGHRYYQLAHDYLVHSLRDWLTHKQKETRQGRAELRLADYSVTWNARQENRFLPSWREHLNIRLFTDRRKWTQQQRLMMTKAVQVHGIRTAVAALFVFACLMSGLAIRNRIEERQQDLVASRLVEGLLSADTAQVRTIIRNLSTYRDYAADDLAVAYDRSPNDSNAKLHAALAMVSEDDSVVPFVRDRLLSVSSAQFAPVRDLLEPYKHSLLPEYWEIAGNTTFAADRRFQAACALASFDPDSEQWSNPAFGEFVAGHLVNVLPSELLPWRNAVRPVQQHLVVPLAAAYRNNELGERVRSFASDTLTDYLSEDADGLFNLLADANQRQFHDVFNKLEPHRKRAVELGTEEVRKTVARDADEEAREALARRQANACIMLLRMNAADQVWPLLKYSEDPRTRSYIIHALSHQGVDPGLMADRFYQESDVTIQRALLLGLGQFEQSLLAESQRTALIKTVVDTYRSHPDAGLHSAAEWLLRKWGQNKQVVAIDVELRKNDKERAATVDNASQWYVNSQGQTYVIMDARVFAMGSPETEPERKPDEPLHQRMIGRQLAVASKEVTRKQWREFSNSAQVWSADHEQVAIYSRTDDSPMVAMTWYEAAHYCNWLSEQEGIPGDQWCYEPNEQKVFGTGMKAKDDFWKLNGYRLPTEAEWEFACRAGSKTIRYYGQSDSLLSQYAWSLANGENHVWPVGGLKPNDFGLFDMHGNAMEWCYEAYGDYPSGNQITASDKPATLPVLDSERRMLRGLCFFIRPANVRSAQRNSHQPGNRDGLNTFRPVRTLKVLVD